MSVSSSSDASSSPSSSPLLSKFDPFAVHPFTNCSVTQNGHNPPTSNYHAYAYPYAGRHAHNPPHGPNTYTSNAAAQSNTTNSQTSPSSQTSNTSTKPQPIPASYASRKYC